MTAQPRYDTLDVITALYLIHFTSHFTSHFASGADRANHGVISRAQLSCELGKGEGTARSVLNILKRKGLIRSSKLGHCLSRAGFKYILSAGFAIKPVKLEMLKDYVAYASVCNLPNLKLSLQHRDVAVMNGALGALMFCTGNGSKSRNSSSNIGASKLEMPHEPDFAKNYPKDYKALSELFAYKSGDKLIIAFAQSKSKCIRASIATLMQLSKSAKNSAERIIK